jgi:hypothetical protein
VVRSKDAAILSRRRRLANGGCGRRHCYRQHELPVGESGARGNGQLRHLVGPADGGAGRLSWFGVFLRYANKRCFRSPGPVSLARGEGAAVSLGFSLRAPRNWPLRTGRCRVRRLRSSFNIATSPGLILNETPTGERLKPDCSRHYLAGPRVAPRSSKTAGPSGGRLGLRMRQPRSTPTIISE